MLSRDTHITHICLPGSLASWRCMPARTWWHYEMDTACRSLAQYISVCRGRSCMYTDACIRACVPTCIHTSMRASVRPCIPFRCAEVCRVSQTAPSSRHASSAPAHSVGTCAFSSMNVCVLQHAPLLSNPSMCGSHGADFGDTEPVHVRITWRAFRRH